MYTMDTMDDRDEAILLARMAARSKIEGPRVGDVVFINGEKYRFCYDLGDRIQIANGPDGSYYFLSNGNMDYSGTLRPPISKSKLTKRTQLMEETTWFFHHDQPQAHNGVYVTVPVHVYDYTENENDCL